MAGALRASASALQASPLRTLPSASRFSATVSRASSSSSSSPVAALRSSFAGAAVPRSGRKAAASPAQTETRRAFMGTTTSAATFEGKTFYDFEVEDIKGKTVPLSEYKGKVALVVNVASQCGLTDSNYKGLNEIYEKYKDQGFVVLAFPSNQFGAQEPGSNEQIENFACSRYKATFPLFSKVDVNGPNTVPVYQFLKSQKGGGILGSDIKWNFGKFLVDKEGKVVERYAPTTSPQSIENDIKKLL